MRGEVIEARPLPSLCFTSNSLFLKGRRYVISACSLPSVVYLMILDECGVYIRWFGGIGASGSVRCRRQQQQCRENFVHTRLLSTELRDKWPLGTFPSIHRSSFCSQPAVVVATAIAAAVTATAIHSFRRHPSLGGPSIVNMALLMLLHPPSPRRRRRRRCVHAFCNTHTSSIDTPLLTHSIETYMSEGRDMEGTESNKFCVRLACY
ncbi:hypothetical protein WUBG_00476 [Wuchereria bancrofti]|uniref:Uncharacterized protein n=1 Tax=Wuchereria bancrofti TaxID=6293 RepID=J9BM64_WUCBA|nr:hypothetical protein WUBG_00476 [Wuchereria bancrofti]